MPDVPETKLTIEEARSPGDYLFLRRLRNEVRGSMTNHTGHIGYWQQLKFYVATRYRPTPVTIFIARRSGRRAGYLLIRETANSALATAAVDRQFRQQGVGREILAFALRRYPNLVGQVKADNAASIAMCRSLGFEPDERAGDSLIYRFRR